MAAELTPEPTELIDWAARKARARAFVRQELKPRQHWADRPYAYDREDQMYLCWMDDNPKKATGDKISEAIAAYVQRFGTRPNIVLVSRDEGVAERADIQVRTEGYIRRNNFWVGWEDVFHS